MLAKKVAQKLTDITATKARNELMKILQGAGIPCRPQPSLGFSNPYEKWQRLGFYAEKTNPDKVSKVLDASGLWNRNSNASLNAGSTQYNRSENVYCYFRGVKGSKYDYEKKSFGGGWSQGDDFVDIAVIAPKKAKPLTIPYYD